MTMTSAAVCTRCGKQSPDGEAPPIEWEATLDGGAICAECVSPAEQQAMDEDTMRIAEKVRENRLRRMAERQGLALVKSRRRDRHAWDYGTYMLLDVATNGVVASGSQQGYGLDMDAIESELEKGRRK